MSETGQTQPNWPVRTISGQPPNSGYRPTASACLKGAFSGLRAVPNDFRFWQLELDDGMSSEFLAHGHVVLRAIWLLDFRGILFGDNLEWEVDTPRRLGIYAIWMDVHGEGLPSGSTVKPDRVIRSLAELLPVEGRQQLPAIIRSLLSSASSMPSEMKPP
jgi:hypothetical protein